MTLTESDAGRRSMPPSALPGAARSVANWLHWRAGDGVAPSFDPRQIAALPEPARRWLNHSIDPGTTAPRALSLAMHGRIALGRRWHNFRATQVLVPWIGFVWAARTELGGLPVTGFDSYAGGEGRMRWRMLGLPVHSESSPSVACSSAGRLAAEAVLLPTSLIGASWTAGHEADSATYRHPIDGRHARPRVTVHVEADGRLSQLHLMRWGRPAGASWAEHRFEVHIAGEFDADGLRIPNNLRAAWVLRGDRQEFFTATIDAAAAGVALLA